MAVGTENTGRVADGRLPPTWYSSGHSSRLCTGLSRLRDSWANALDSARGGRGSHSWGEEGRKRSRLDLGCRHRLRG